MEAEQNSQTATPATRSTARTAHSGEAWSKNIGKPMERIERIGRMKNQFNLLLSSSA
jgi:hypothetical protein